jgi:hypothetical protein
MRERLRAILDVRARRPQAIAEAAARRKRRPALLGDDNQLFIIAADHPARGALRVGERPMAMAEPFISHRVDGRVRNDLSPEAVARSIAVASGLGATSAYTWLKVPVVEHMERVLAASTLPALLLGGEVSADQGAAFEGWRKALQMPSVHGLVVGRTLLFPPDDDVTGAVAAAVGLVRG